MSDRELAARDAASGADERVSGADERAMTSAEFARRAAESRGRATADRAAAAKARAQAAANREHEARDRGQAARERLQAHADRDALAHQLAIAETDEVTGTRARAAGLADVEREIDRARRTSGPLAIAYVDVVGLRAINDAYGHAAGNALIQRAVPGIRRHLRSYDTIVRLGDDEFLCVMPGATIQDARQRLGAIQTALATNHDPCEIKIGFAELTPEDNAAKLIQRADAELLKAADASASDVEPRNTTRLAGFD
ncbi:MAG: GGDEF domain-containing protein [Solirubrobacteraceae bacterium]